MKNYKYNTKLGKLIDLDKVKDKSKLSNPALIDIEMEVAEAEAIFEMQRQENSSECKRKYYCTRSLDLYSESNRNVGSEEFNPIEIMIKAEEAQEDKLSQALATLTTRQLELVKMLSKGMSVPQIAEAKGKHHSSVYEMLEAVQKKFSKFF